MKSRSHGKERPRQRRRVRIYSMLVTIGLLTAMLIGSYLTLQPRVETLPNTVPFHHEDWMSFIPDSSQFAAFVDYQACFEATGNYSLFGTGPLLEIYSPPFVLYPKSIEYELAVNLPVQGSKQESSSVSVLKIDSQELRNLEAALQSSTTIHRTTYGSYTVFDLLARHKERETQLASATLTMVREHILVAEGVGTMALLTQILDAPYNEQSQLFSSASARSALYAAGGASDDYVALFIATFPTQIEGATIVMKTVKSTAGSVVSQIAFSFESQDKARSQYQAVKNLYTGGSDYWILSQFVIAKFNHETSQLGEQVRGL